MKLDLLTIESVSNRLHEIAISDRITSNEAQWIVRARDILEDVRVFLLQASALERNDR